MDTGIATKKTSWGAFLNYVDKKQNGKKKCRNETKKITWNPTNKYVIQQTNQYINVKKMKI